MRRRWKPPLRAGSTGRSSPVYLSQSPPPGPLQLSLPTGGVSGRRRRPHGFGLRGERVAEQAARVAGERRQRAREAVRGAQMSAVGWRGSGEEVATRGRADGPE
eukprot:scaffold30597_cov28-Tisochrysis_lutea.AAC.6